MTDKWANVCVWDYVYIRWRGANCKAIYYRNVYICRWGVSYEREVWGSIVEGTLRVRLNRTGRATGTRTALSSWIRKSSAWNEPKFLRMPLRRLENLVFLVFSLILQMFEALFAIGNRAFHLPIHLLEALFNLLNRFLGFLPNGCLLFLLLSPYLGAFPAN